MNENPYRHITQAPTFVKLPNEDTYVRVEDVISIEEWDEQVRISFRDGHELCFDSDNPSRLARNIAETLNG